MNTAADLIFPSRILASLPPLPKESFTTGISAREWGVIITGHHGAECLVMRQGYACLGAPAKQEARIIFGPQAAPITKTTADDYLRFSNLRDGWYGERGITSSITEMVMCPSYLGIIGMGERALPLIIQQLKSEGNDPDHWFVALQAITNVNPVPQEAHGDMAAMAQAWIRWAVAHYYAR
jgi:hypothetical protein